MIPLSKYEASANPMRMNIAPVETFITVVQRNGSAFLIAETMFRGLREVCGAGIYL
jgi:hypothetical protein